MKTLICLLALVSFCFAGVASADTCVKQKRHTDEYYYGGTVTPAEDIEIEIWFGGQRMVYVTPNRIVVVDAEKDVLLFANKTDSSYVETTLPFDWANVVDEGTVGYLGQYMTEGTVEATGETKEILGRKCELIKVETWIESEGQRFNQRDELVWVTTDLPIDWEVYEKINRNSMKLLNYDDSLIETFAAIKGVPVQSEADVYMQGFSVKSTEEPIEIMKTESKAEVYTLPSYFKKKDQLTMADLRG